MNFIKRLFMRRDKATQRLIDDLKAQIIDRDMTITDLADDMEMLQAQNKRLEKELAKLKGGE